MAQSSKEWASRRVQQNKQVQSAFAFMARGNGGTGGFDVDGVDAETIGSAVVRWTGSGYALTLGLSSDGGAFNVKLHAGGQVESKWFTSAKDLEDFLSAIPGREDAQ